MKLSKKFFPLMLILAATFLGTACSGRRFIPEGWPGITVDGDTAYVSYRNHVFFIDQNGNEVDRFPAEAENGATFFAQPVLTEDGGLLVGSYNGQFYNVNVDNAQINSEWSVRQARFIGSPLVVNNVIYAPSTNNQLSALTMDLEELEGFSFENSLPLWSAPISDGELLYVTAQDHNLYALNLSNGSVVWQHDMGGTMASSAVLDEAGVLYAGTFGSQVIALDTHSQTELWAFNASDWVWATPTVADGIVYAADFGGTVYAIDAATGSQLWRFDSGSSIPGSVLVHEGQIYFGNEAGSMYALTLEGTEAWKRELGIEDASVFGTPVAFGDNLILFGVVDTDLFIAAYDSNGATQWQFAPDAE